jgi:hypothetical protein
MEKFLIDLNNNKNDTQPVLNNGYYDGQGFGRLLEHALTTCLFSGFINRQFKLDLSTRDPLGIFQQYFTTSHIDWIPKNIDVDKINSYLKNKGDGQIEDLEFIEPNIIPMNLKNNKDKNSQNEALLYWNSNKENILFSPNWGDAWFPHMNYLFQNFYLEKFNRNVDKDRPYNILFKLTEKSEKIYKTLKNKIFGENFKEKYGAIHIRSLFEYIHFSRTDKDIISSVKSVLNNFTDIKYWCLMCDNIELSNKIIKEIPELLHNYDNNYVDNHSISIVGKNTVKQEEISGFEKSLEDWLLIAKSDVSIITSGAFGETASSSWNNKRFISGHDNKKVFNITKDSKINLNVYSNFNL